MTRHPLSCNSVLSIKRYLPSSTYVYVGEVRAVTPNEGVLTEKLLTIVNKWDFFSFFKNQSKYLVKEKKEKKEKKLLPCVWPSSFLSKTIGMHLYLHWCKLQSRNLKKIPCHGPVWYCSKKILFIFLQIYTMIPLPPIYVKKPTTIFHNPVS